MEKEKTAYHQWLIANSQGDHDELVQLLKRDILDQNPQAFELLETTGDEKFTGETFEKAAKLLLEE